MASSADVRKIYGLERGTLRLSNPENIYVRLRRKRPLSLLMCMSIVKISMYTLQNYIILLEYRADFLKKVPEKGS